MVSVEEWIRVRRGLRLGQRLSGTVTAVPAPGATGLFVDVGLPVGGFVDVLLLPGDGHRWPAVGTVAEFEVWWADKRPQVRLKPVDRRFLREDFDEWRARWRPGWPENVPVDQAWVEAEAAPLREAGAVEETLRAAGWWPGRRVPVRPWREMLEATGLVRMHEAAELFLSEFGGLDVRIDGPGIDVAKTRFHFDPEPVAGEEDRFADWSATVGKDLFPIGELDGGRFFLGIDENSEIYLIETWVATFGPAQEALERLILGIAPRRIG
ncbi:SUKH-3 domain-containing protein [Kitasatospora sp. RG8]|uniref:SUKH-3 domain-containing protein n=1 Tax=Kitasatospora sp. RG8 TaxID=2820815 RepID=UPI001ADF1DEE|nr:SUKH-3 domain-containing protein [Kitasatospora sp. RG8]MBP0450991.1 SUKH-3 domain-containing protein [Kitasatospora sp. RG8]